jgi:hypothetical protein
MVKWLRSNENLTGAVIANKNFDHFRENVAAAVSLAMNEQDHAVLALLAACGPVSRRLPTPENLSLDQGGRPRYAGAR